MQMCHSGVDIFAISLLRISNINCRISIVPVPRSRSGERPLCRELLMLIWFCTFHRTISCLHVDFECFKLAPWPTLNRIFWTFEAFLLVHAIMTKLVHMWSKLTILPWVSRFFNFSHDNTPTLMVFREISFWNEMFLCSLTTEMFTVAVS